VTWSFTTYVIGGSESTVRSSDLSASILQSLESLLQIQLACGDSGTKEGLVPYRRSNLMD
jgi:hypothetical protein